VARVRFVLNNQGVRELLNSPEVARDLHDRMRPVLAAAVAASDDSGDYEDSLEIVDDHTDRARSRVVADVPSALAREARDRTLGRAMDAAGD
jgi:hypothetical protein